MTDWDTPVSASRSIFIPSGLRAAAPSLESSLIVQIGISSQPREHAFVQGAGEKGRLSSSRVPLVQVWGQHSTRCTSCTYPSKHKRNWAAPALLGCRFKHNEGAASNSWHLCSSSYTLHREGGGSARQCITRPHRQQEERWRSPTRNGRGNSGKGGRSSNTLKDSLFTAKKGWPLSLDTDDFVVDNRDRQADLVVQSLPDHYLQKIFEPSWDSINEMETKEVLRLFRIRARVRNFSAAEMSKFRDAYCKVTTWLELKDYPIQSNS